MKAARGAWFEGQSGLDPERLIFIDESGLSTKMARLRGWAPKGERCRAAIPHGHWKTITFVGGLTLNGFIAPMLLDGPMNGDCFRAWIEQMLAPALRPGHLVIMDNLPAHKVAGVKEAIAARSGDLRYLPLTVQTSILSKTPSPSSRPMSARLLRALSKRSKQPRPARSGSSVPAIASTSLPTLATAWIKGNLL